MRQAITVGNFSAQHINKISQKYSKRKNLSQELRSIVLGKCPFSHRHSKRFKTKRLRSHVETLKFELNGRRHVIMKQIRLVNRVETRLEPTQSIISPHSTNLHS